MVGAFKQYWKVYLIEAWALGMFMISACCFGILLDHPMSPLHQAIESPVVRRIIGGMAMGLTALCLFYSSLGKKSGTHMNPAVTLAFLHLHRIKRVHAMWYIIAQFVGAALAIWLIRILAGHFISSPEVNYVVTKPGMYGVGAAFLAEFVMAFIMFYTVLLISNSKWAAWTGCVAATLVFLFISIEGPLSGMSINPARTTASAIHAWQWDGWWLYFLAPIGGMWLAATFFRKNFMRQHEGDCSKINVQFSDDCRVSVTYEVLFPPAA